MITKKDLRRE